MPKNKSTAKGRPAKTRTDPEDQTFEHASSLAKFPEENPLPVFRAELSGKVIYANPAARNLLGLALAPKYGRLTGELAKILRSRKQGKRLPKELETEIGERLFVFAVAYVGKGSYVNFYGRDVTERRHAEAELVAAKEAAAQSEALFKDAIEHLSEAFVIYDTDGRLVACNKEFRQIYGYSEEDAKPGVHYKDLGKLDIKLGNVFIGNEYGGGEAYLKRRAEYRRKLTGSFTVHLKDGRWLHTTDRRTSSGGIVSIQRDITEAMRTSDALRAAKEEAENANKVIGLRQRIAAAANEATIVEDAVQVCLDEVCAYTGWPVGHAFAVTPEGDLKSMKVWHLDQPKRFAKFREITESRIYPKGKGISSRVLSTGKPVWNNDVSKDRGFKRAVLTKGIQVKAGFAFPVLVGKDVAAVIEFFSEQTVDPDAALLDMTAHVGNLLGRVIERNRAETEVAEKEALLSASLSNMSDGIFVLDPDERIVMFNERYVELMEISSDQLELGLPTGDWIRRLAESGFYGPGRPPKTNPGPHGHSDRQQPRGGGTIHTVGPPP